MSLPLSGPLAVGQRLLAARLDHHGLLGGGVDEVAAVLAPGAHAAVGPEELKDELAFRNGNSYRFRGGNGYRFRVNRLVVRIILRFHRGPRLRQPDLRRC